MNVNATAEDSDLLKEIHRDKVMEYLPIMVLLAVLAILGIVGNSFTIKFYSTQRRRSSTSAFIQYLGVIDLSVCILSFNSITDLAVNVYFTSSLLCKLMYCCVHSFISASVLVLWIISIDRYLKVCRSLGTQLPATWAKPIVGVVVLFSFSVSSCDLFTYDSVPVGLKVDSERFFKIWTIKNVAPVTNVSTHNGTNRGSFELVPLAVYGHYCTIAGNTEFLLTKQIFNAVEVIIIVMVIFTFMIAYGLILQTLLKNSKRQSSHANRDQLPARYGNQRKAKFTETSISVMMAVVSLALVLSFIPYFIIAVSRILTNTSESELSALHQLALRSPYLNSVINPVIFCIFNPTYRNYVVRSFAKRTRTENIMSMRPVRPIQDLDDTSTVRTQSTVLL